jgi:hypothetical protein
MIVQSYQTPSPDRACGLVSVPHDTVSPSASFNSFLPARNASASCSIASASSVRAPDRRILVSGSSISSGRRRLTMCYSRSRRIALLERFWQARHPLRYAAYLIPSSPSLPHSSGGAAGGVAREAVTSTDPPAPAPAGAGPRRTAHPSRARRSNGFRRCTRNCWISSSARSIAPGQMKTDECRLKLALAKAMKRSQPIVGQVFSLLEKTLLRLPHARPLFCPSHGVLGPALEAAGPLPERRRLVSGFRIAPHRSLPCQSDTEKQKLARQAATRQQPRTRQRSTV